MPEQVNNTVKVSNKWDVESLKSVGMPFLITQKDLCKTLANTTISQLKTLAFLVPFDGSETKKQIKALRIQIADCYDSANHYRKSKIVLPAEHSKLDEVVKQAFKQINFLDYLNETVTNMERKNVLVLSSVAFGVAAICGAFARCAFDQKGITDVLEGVTLVFSMASALSAAFSPIYNDVLKDNYKVRSQLIQQQFQELILN